MPVFVPSLGLAYFPVPKNACTSLKRCFYEMNEGRPFQPWRREDGRMAYIHDTPGYLSPEFNPAFLERTRGQARLALVRHPLRRLVSAYKNRVLHHRELSPKALGQRAMEELGLPPHPSFEVFVERLPDYVAVSSSIRHHTRPQRHFLGPDLSAFEHLCKVEEMPRVQALLERLAGRPVALPHLQQGGHALPDPEITPETRRRMLEFCGPDLEYLAGHYDVG